MQIKKILLVDDERHVRRIMELTLSSTQTWEIIAVGSGKEALEKAAQEKPDLILLDVRMPEMDGVATLKELRAVAETAGIAVIFLTAGQSHEEASKGDALVLGTISKGSPMTVAEKILTLTKDL
jgi:CheY-like chemotaxis protein